jgi:hypothetical protein
MKEIVRKENGKFKIIKENGEIVLKRKLKLCDEMESFSALQVFSSDYIFSCQL